jgi:hypothetical protein
MQDSACRGGCMRCGGGKLAGHSSQRCDRRLRCARQAGAAGLLAIGFLHEDGVRQNPTCREPRALEPCVRQNRRGPRAGGQPAWARVGADHHHRRRGFCRGRWCVLLLQLAQQPPTGREGGARVCGLGAAAAVGRNLPKTGSRERLLARCGGCGQMDTAVSHKAVAFVPLIR